MGEERTCLMQLGRRRLKGRALLESQDLIFRGDLKLAIPFRDMRKVVAKDGVLTVEFPDGTAKFDLGDLATRWAEKIKNPKSVIDKLGVKPGMKVAALGIDDRGFLAQLRERAGTISSRPAPGSDLVFFGVETLSALSRLGSLADAIAPAGGIWVVWRKGRPQLKEDHIRDAGKASGLTDIKVVAFSDTHSALKLVIPVSKRGR